MYKFVVLSVCVAVAMGAVRREAPAAGGQNVLEDLKKQAEAFGKAFSEQFNSIVNSKNTEEVNKALKKGSDDVLQQLSTLSNSLQSALGDANGKAKEALEKSRADIEKTIADLRKAHPEVEQQSNALKEKFQNAIQTTTTQAQKLAKEVAESMEATNQKLAPQIKQAYDDFLKQAEAVQKQIHDAATKQ